MLAQMMQMPLMISSLIRHADRCHGDTEIVSRLPEGGIHRYTYHDAHRRARQLARALTASGVQFGERIATLAWNTHRHLEFYYAVSGMGAVCHTINPRLFPEQIAYIINHAEDSQVFFDLSFAGLVEELAPRCPTVQAWVALTDKAHLPESRVELVSYEELIAAHDDDFEWPSFDENTASSLCYTSGTTGNPKGVLYSHRSTLLHAFSIAMPDAMGLSACDTVLPVVPMFHVNAWGLIYAGPLVGCKLVLPGPKLDGASLHELFEQEEVTFTAGVPTVWLALLQHLQANRLPLNTLRRMVVGGSAAPPSLIESFDKHYGVAVQHGWGMTEMSPLGTLNTPKGKHRAWPEAARQTLRIKQGRPRSASSWKSSTPRATRYPTTARPTATCWRAALRVQRLLQGEQQGSLAPGRLVCHRRCGHPGWGRLHADHRPLQGHHQVRRRVDQLHRTGKPGRRPPGGGGSRGDRRAPSQMGRTAAPSGRQETGRGADSHRTAGFPARQGLQVVAA